MPMLDPAAIRVALAALAETDADIATLAAEITDPAALADTSVNKVAAGFADPSRPARALYFSKAAVPWGEGPHYEHVGLYAYRRAALDRFVTPAARRPRTARAARTAARARSRDAHLGEPDRQGAARRPGRYAGRPRPRPRADGESGDNRVFPRTRSIITCRASRLSRIADIGREGVATTVQSGPDDRLSGLAGGLFRPGVPAGVPGNDEPALRRVRGRLRGGARRRGAAGDDPDRELGRRAGRRHPPSDARIPASTSSASISSG